MTQRFNIGDRVKVVGGGGYYCRVNEVTIGYMRSIGFTSGNCYLATVGDYIITEVSFCKLNNMHFYRVAYYDNWISENGLALATSAKLKEELTIKPKNIMKKLTNFYKKLVDEDTQKLVKAGYINGDLEPTEKAEDAIKEILFFQFKSDLVKRAEEEIKEEEEKNK